MTEEKKKIAIIVGSTRPGRNAEKVLAWFMPHTKEIENLAFEVIDLKDWPLPFFDEPGYPSQGPSVYEHESTKRWSEKISEFDGFIVLSPEYNHGYSAVLKNAFDYLYKEWNGKPISFVSWGSAAGGSRAVEQLRMVAIELQMLPLREQVVISLSDFLPATDFSKWDLQARKTIEQLSRYFKK